MNEANLLLTLGHGASAILVLDSGGVGNIAVGYEEERLSLLKSDSRFPINAIKRCLTTAGLTEVDNVYVTHWNPANRLDLMSKKHWRPDLLPPHKRVLTHGSHGGATFNSTHHDAHAHAALWYAYGGSMAGHPTLKPANTMMFVIDGFGNYGEHISIYKLTGYGPKLIRRFFGYGGSMGLMYQYMTAFLGMKQHEDEYKLLGYETMIHEADVDTGLLQELINSEISRYLDSYFDAKKLSNEFDPVLQTDALPALQKDLIDRWTKVCKALGVEPLTHECRIVMSYYVQAVLEGVILTLVKVYNPTNLICSGGVFFNVKLNRMLAEKVPGKLCVFPLAGDQGNAIGLYNEMHGGLTYPGHFFWGKRLKAKNPRDMYVHLTDNVQTAAGLALERLKSQGLVNLVRGSMEYGPRALCNTSTLALPKPGVVNRINAMNHRNTVMPMAPVMSRTEYEARMKFTYKIHMSEQHMIVALPYKNDRYSDVLGAAHRYDTEFTGRPQVLDGDPLMDQLFSEYPVLINTSFNVHGVPIVLDMEHVVDSHKKQQQVAPVTTIYLEEA